MSAEKTPPYKGFECRFAVHVEPEDQNKPDMHLVKLQTHQHDGTIKPEVKLIYNYQRPFWISNKGSRNYQQHKEWEDVANLIEYKTSQSNMVRSISRAIGFPGFKGNLKRLCENPYIYGVEILSTAIIKKTLNDRYPELKSRYTVAVGDIETDVVNGTEDIIMMSITFKNSVTLAVLKSYLTGEINVQDKFNKAVSKYLSAVEVEEINKETKEKQIKHLDVISSRGINVELKIVDNELDLIKTIFNKAHELKPDFFAFWNIDFDIPKIVKAIEKFNIDPKTIFSDPTVPKDYQYFKYKQGPKQKVTASGLVTPIKPAAQWHTVFCPSSFYLIDAMCVYKQVRTGKQEEQSYGLDPILKKNGLGGKLKFTGADGYSGLKWHQIMQSNFKIEYMVYNLWDCISIEMLDEKNSDLAMTMPMFAGFSDFQHFNSQPRRLVDKLHYFCLERGRVIGVTPPKDKTKSKDSDEDNENVAEFDGNDEDDGDEEEHDVSEQRASQVSLSLRGWIITLPAHLITDTGLKCIEEYPELRTNCFGHAGD